MPIKSLSEKLVGTVQFNIHFSFRTEVHPLKPLTPRQKLALVDTVQARVAKVWNRKPKRENFYKSVRKLDGK